MSQPRSYVLLLTAYFRYGQFFIILSRELSNRTKRPYRGGHCRNSTAQQGMHPLSCYNRQGASLSKPIAGC